MFSTFNSAPKTFGLTSLLLASDATFLRPAGRFGGPSFGPGRRNRSPQQLRQSSLRCQPVLILGTLALRVNRQDTVY